MSSRHGYPRWVGAVRVDLVLSRAFVAVIAVIAVLAMHGLTMNHDAAMASMSTIGPATVVEVGHMDPRSSAHVGPSTGTHKTVLTTSMAVPVDATESRVSSQHPADRMTTACLAFLAGLVLLVGPCRMLVRLRPKATSGRNTHSVSWFATAVDRLRPDLGKLSVLRT